MLSFLAFFVPSIIAWLIGRRRRKHLGKYRKAIDDIYNKLQKERKDENVKDDRENIEDLENLRLEITEQFDKGKISE